MYKISHYKGDPIISGIYYKTLDKSYIIHTLWHKGAKNIV